VSRRVITLTTDFGHGSAYVAAMKGVILSINPEAALVDISHDIPPQDIRRAALVLADVCDRFPAETIHVAVVDPGVGSARRIIYMHLGTQHYIAPDNGLLSALVVRRTPTKIVELAEPSFWLEPVSPTFHGRDVMAPVAARLSLGLDPERLGVRRDEIVRLVWPEVKVSDRRIAGMVQSVDSFGNLITNITAEELAAIPAGIEVHVRCGEHETFGIFRTYSDQPPMTLIALVGSSGRLELAIVDDSAAAMLGESAGSEVTLSW